MAEISWIKLDIDVFNDRKIKQIETLPDGDSILIIWFKILCLAGETNDQGYIYFTPEIPYTDEMLATQFNRPLSIVKYALSIFEQFGMIGIEDDILHVSAWAKHQNVEGMDKVREQNRLRKQNQREREKLEERCHVTSRDSHATDIDIDIDKDIDIYSQRFESFWKAYPKKVGKKDAQKSFNKIKPSEELLNKMISVIEKAKQTDQWTKNNGQFIPNPSTWLNQGRWEDDISSYQQRTSSEGRVIEDDRYQSINF